MIIFRKLFSKLINDDRLFTENRQDEIKYLIKCSKTTTMEFLKALEMYYYDYQDVDHWLDKAVGYMLNMSNKESVKSYMSFICLLEEEDIENLVGQDGLDFVGSYYRADSRSDILNQIKLSVKQKYSKIEKDNQVKLFNEKDSYYFDVIKYVTLCVCGEINPNYWKNKNSWINKTIPDIKAKKIAYSKTPQDTTKLHNLLLDCIEHILYLK